MIIEYSQKLTFMSTFGSINIMDYFDTRNILLPKTAFMPFLGNNKE